MKRLFFIMALASPTYAQTLPEASAQDFTRYQNEKTGLTALYPVIGFGPADLEPSGDDTVFMNDDFTIMVSFETVDWSALGTPYDLLQSIRTEISRRDTFLSEGGDHNGTVFAWAGHGNMGHIKVVFLQDCPLAGVLRVAYPETEDAIMAPYFSALALGFELTHSPACPALVN